MNLDDISSEAEMKERANLPKTTPVQVYGIETNDHKSVKRCFFCRGDKGKTRTAENCATTPAQGCSYCTATGCHVHGTQRHNT